MDWTEESSQPPTIHWMDLYTQHTTMDMYKLEILMTMMYNAKQNRPEMIFFSLGMINCFTQYHIIGFLITHGFHYYKLIIINPLYNSMGSLAEKKDYYMWWKVLSILLLKMHRLFMLLICLRKMKNDVNQHENYVLEIAYKNLSWVSLILKYANAKVILPFYYLHSSKSSVCFPMKLSNYQ